MGAGQIWAITIMKIKRVQYPVGQGGFAAGCIRNKNGDRFDYVYDCGSADTKELRTWITAYTNSTDKLDKLFVSHLDDDHVNGLDKLLSLVSVDTVYLPYIDEIAPILEVLEAVDNGEHSASLTEALINPRAWFGSRGVRRVVLIDGSGEDPSDGPIIPAEPLDRDPSERFEIKESGQAKKLKVPSKDGLMCQLDIVKQGISITIGAGLLGVFWLLVPYVHPVDVREHKAFKRALRKVLNLGPRKQVTTRVLVERLKSEADRKLIKDCYERLIKRGAKAMHNRLSMSLFSGPHPLGVHVRMIRYDAKSHAKDFSEIGYTPEHDIPIGWLGTGDADLKTKFVRKKLITFFKSLALTIGTLVLPHHGSRHSFDQSLLTEWPLHLCVAAAGYRDRHYCHPHGDVVQLIEDADIEFVHVSPDQHSALSEDIYLH